MQSRNSRAAHGRGRTVIDLVGLTCQAERNRSTSASCSGTFNAGA